MRYAAAVAVLALVLAGCASETPGPPTGVSKTAATLHAGIKSTVNGPTEAWFSYGLGTNPSGWTDTDQQTIDVTTRGSYPVSVELGGLSPGTTYHWRVCAQDHQFGSPVKTCSPNQTFTTDPEQAHLYVAMGDSLTNTGGTSGVHYPERFFAFLGSSDTPAADQLYNDGVSGETSDSLMGNQLTVAKQHIDQPDTDTTVLTIDIGGNDLRGDPACLPPSPSFNIDTCQPTIQTFATNLEDIFDSLDASLGADPGAEQVIAIAYYNPWSGRVGEETAAARGRVAMLGTDDQIDCAGTGTERGFNDVIACTAADHGAKLADLLPPFNGHGTISTTNAPGAWFADEVHPNDTGHQEIANVLADVFQAP